MDACNQEVELTVSDGSEQSPAPGDEAMAVRGFLVALWRYWWAIGLVIVVAGVAAGALSATQTYRYRADALIVYEGEAADVVTLSVQIQNVGSAMAGPNMQRRVAQQIGHALPPETEFSVSVNPYSLDSGQLQSGLYTTTTNLAMVEVESANAGLSAQLANAFVSSFVAWRTETVRSKARRAAEIVRAQLAAFDQKRRGGAADFSLLSSTYVELSQSLTDLRATAATGTGGYRLVKPATAPTGPFSPRPLRSAVVGMGVGLLAAIAFTFLLYRFGPRLSGAEEARYLLGLPVLGRVPQDRGDRSGTSGVASVSEPTSLAAEAYRRLRASVNSTILNADVKVILFSSSSAGEGTSGTVANLAVALSQAGRRVVVVDADLRRPTQQTYFDLPNDKGVTSVALGQTSVSESLQPIALSAMGELTSAQTRGLDGEPAEPLCVLTSGPSVADPGETVAGHAMAAIVSEVKQHADVVLVDSPGLLDAADASALAGVVDALVFVVDARVTSRPALKECKEYLDLVPCRQLGVVIMQESRRHARRGRGRAKHAPAVTPEATESAADTVSVSPGG